MARTGNLLNIEEMIKHGSHPVLLSQDLQEKPVRVQSFGLDLVFFRDKDGKPQALDNRCPHRGAKLHLGQVDQEGRVVCPYHGWAFSGNGCGKSPFEPGKKNCNTKSYQVAEFMSAIWLVGDAEPSIEGLPADFEHAGATVVEFRAPLRLVIDNFTEMEHLAFVHKNLGVDTLSLANSGFSIQESENIIDARIKAEQRPSPLQFLFGTKKGDLFSNQWTTSFKPLKTRYIQTWSCPKTGRERRAAFIFEIYFVPRDANTTAVVSLVFVRPPELYRFGGKSLLHWALRQATRYEQNLDRKFLEANEGMPEDLYGMALGTMDKPLVKIRERLGDLYKP